MLRTNAVPCAFSLSRRAERSELHTVVSNILWRIGQFTRNARGSPAIDVGRWGLRTGVRRRCGGLYAGDLGVDRFPVRYRRWRVLIRVGFLNRR